MMFAAEAQLAAEHRLPHASPPDRTNSPLQSAADTQPNTTTAADHHLVPGRPCRPSLARLDFSRGARRSSPPRDEDIVVVDGFWPDPWALRRFAVKSEFQPRLSPSGFAFHERPWSRSHTLRMAELASRACGARLLDCQCESRFVFETMTDEKITRQRVWVHCDRWFMVGVLYLVPDEIARGGTGFYRHRASGLSSVHHADARGLRTTVMADSTSDEAWDTIEQVAIRFNRMVLFKPHIFHQAAQYFGNDVHDARLYCIVAFDDQASKETGDE